MLVWVTCAYYDRSSSTKLHRSRYSIGKGLIWYREPERHSIYLYAYSRGVPVTAAEPEICVTPSAIHIITVSLSGFTFHHTYTKRIA